MILHGVNIVPHPMAVQWTWLVRPHAIRKRRRNWSAVKVEQPGCWQIGDTFYMHPDLVDKLRSQATPKAETK